MGVFRRIVMAAAMAALTVAFLVTPARAATALEAEIVSWQVIGLDSNQPATALPEVFLVQAKVTNTGAEAAANASATLALGSLTPNPCDPDPCVSLISPATVSLGTLAPAGTTDAFWSVRVAKTPAAFDTLTPVTVTAVADNAPQITATQSERVPAPCGATDTPGGSLLVERLISQNRNDVLGYTVSPATQLPDGSWEVVQGTEFTVEVQAHTATEYDEISVPATADPGGVIIPLATRFTYSQGTASDTDIYTTNAGGDVLAGYDFLASNVGDVTLAQLIYDCSGNSFHYNSDYLADTVTIHVVAAPSQPDIVLSKASSVREVAPGDTVIFTITYRNRGAVTATEVVISDTVDPSLSQVVPSDGGAFDPATRRITWQVGEVGAGEAGTVSFRARVSQAAEGKEIRNLALGDAEELDPFESNVVTISITPILPVSGLPSAVLFLLALSSIGAGVALADRKLEQLAAAGVQIFD